MNFSLARSLEEEEEEEDLDLEEEKTFLMWKAMVVADAGLSDVGWVGGLMGDNTTGNSIL